MYDNITKPHHYGWHPSGVEAKEVIDDLPYWLGDAIACIWRRNHNGQPIDDRLKAIERLNEATTERLEALKWLMVIEWGAGHRIANALEEIGEKPDFLIWDVGILLLTARMNMTCEGLQEIIDQLKDELRAELDEITATPPTRTLDIYKEQ